MIEPLSDKTGVEWALTVQLGDSQSRKITTETIKFRAREFAESQLHGFDNGQILRPNQIYTVENEKGERISFVGERYISHSLRRLETIDFESEM